MLLHRYSVRGYKCGVGMKIPIMTGIEIDVDVIAEQMTLGELISLCSSIGTRFDDDYMDRALLAHSLGDNLSEDGARFLAEVVTARYAQRVSNERN